MVFYRHLLYYQSPVHVSRGFFVFVYFIVLIIKTSATNIPDFVTTMESRPDTFARII